VEYLGCAVAHDLLSGELPTPPASEGTVGSAGCVSPRAFGPGGPLILLGRAVRVSFRPCRETSSSFTALVSPGGGEARSTGSHCSGIPWDLAISSRRRACPGQTPPPVPALGTPHCRPGSRREKAHSRRSFVRSFGSAEIPLGSRTPARARRPLSGRHALLGAGLPGICASA
jgi:hypothetical protein